MMTRRTLTTTLFAVWGVLLPCRGAQRLTLEPKAVFLSAVSPTQTLVCSETRADGATADVTAGAVYASEDTAVATVGGDGVVRGVSKGATYVRATFGGRSAQAFVVVLWASLPTLPPSCHASDATAPVVTGHSLARAASSCRSSVTTPTPTTTRS
ncbi:MAG: hypothetical protein DMG07_22565 [Acidobacteria bacterium]|nr:MAG: hypothetical protein DMG07_22565 [Acidobacteriota bacterium]